MSAPMDSALNRYIEHMGPICYHHRDECPDDCAGQLAWEAVRELAALRKRVEDLEKALKEIAKGAATSMEPPTSSEAACGNLDDAYSDGFARAIWYVGNEARKALGGDE